MIASAVIAAAVAAVLTPRAVVFVNTATAATVGRAALPGEGLAVFAAPDDRAVVPLAGAAGTAVVSATGAVEHWPGRVFPLFFREFDRFYAVLPDLLATLTYPERVELQRIPLAGVSGVRRAACSRDGRLVAVVPEGEKPLLLLVPGLEPAPPLAVPLAGEPSLVALSPDALFAVVVIGGRALQLVVPDGGGMTIPPVPLDGPVLALAVTGSGSTMLAGVGVAGGGEIVGVRVEPGKHEPLRVAFRRAFAAPVGALAAAEDEVVALTGGELVVLSANGKRVRRRVPVAGAIDVALLPSEPHTAVPPWNQGTN